ncbi:ATP-dependent Clp protease adapter protein ClpS [Rhynchospora pubera]|uniref:ATP-dependent Clp protease adapter protein ClpS n=1 Tax=Rhynchospora pubera TaxID=906938 RepID=A0AAV8G5Z7_9POAL|nr:ATP-dependent Clp protease adapter protein ClpS [Rhynchospora pubera]
MQILYDMDVYCVGEHESSVPSCMIVSKILIFNTYRDVKDEELLVITNGWFGRGEGLVRRVKSRVEVKRVRGGLQRAKNTHKKKVKKKKKTEVRIGACVIDMAMETAIYNRLPISSNHFLNSRQGDNFYLFKGQALSLTGGMVTALSATAPGKGGGVLDRPVKEKTPPGRESEFDLKKKKKITPPYRVILHNDDINRREYVVQVLMKVIPGMTLDTAVNIMQEAHHNGLSVVIICSQAEAEEHCRQLRRNGLLSSIEPASGGC